MHVSNFLELPRSLDLWYSIKSNNLETANRKGSPCFFNFIAVVDFTFRRCEITAVRIKLVFLSKWYREMTAVVVNSSFLFVSIYQTRDSTSRILASKEGDSSQVWATRAFKVAEF